MASGVINQPRAKSPIEDRYRSRLMLTYRTDINGTPVPQKLPFRLLVLGQFTNKLTREMKAVPDLEHRPIHSIDRSKGQGKIDDFMAVLQPWIEFPNDLKANTSIWGKVTLVELNAELNGAPGSDEIKARVTGIATFQNKGFIVDGVEFTSNRLFVSADVKVRNGQAVDEFVELKLNGQMAGSTVDVIPARTIVAMFKDSVIKVPKADLGSLGEARDEGKRRYKFSLKLDSEGEGPAAERSYMLEKAADRVLPLLSLANFSPDGVVANTPELRRLQVIRGSMLELQSLLRNTPGLRKAMAAALPGSTPTNEEFKKKTPSSEAYTNKLTKLKSFQKWARGRYPELKIDFKPDSSNEAKELDEPLKETLNSLLGAVNGSVDLLAEDKIKPRELVRQKAATTTETASPNVAQATRLDFSDRNPELTESVRLASALATLLVNIDDISVPTDPPVVGAKDPPIQVYADLSTRINDVIEKVDKEVKRHLDAFMHLEEFQSLEANWRCLNELASNVTSDDVIIDFLDITKDELVADMADNSADFFGSALFQKVYVEEYDRFGGKPFATMIGLYKFASEDSDVAFFKSLMKVCAAAHCPFVSSVGAKFFHRETMEDLAAITDLDAIMASPKMAKWQELRKEDWAAYIGLTLPRYLVRLPWNGKDPDRSDYEKKVNDVQFVEEVEVESKEDNDGFLWGNAAILFAKNVVKSYESSGWAQHIRGPAGGGTIEALTAYMYKRPDGNEVMLNPVEIAIPDYREYQFSRNGFIPLVQRKEKASATFFSVQSIKAPKDFQEDTNTKNAYLVTNLAYTYSITRIAHFVKAMMREYIGSSANGPYIKEVLSNWLAKYVTTVVNPDDLTLLYYPFKSTKVEVEPKPGPLGWYRATIEVFPHVQFEGMDVELRLEAALGEKA